MIDGDSRGPLRTRGVRGARPMTIGIEAKWHLVAASLPLGLSGIPVWAFAIERRAEK